MNILITDRAASKYSVTVRAVVGKVAGVVSVNRRDKSVMALCENASHRVWKGCGKYYPSAEAALDAYKRPEMKAIIRAAVAEFESEVAA